jgi:hypothetical protein
MDEEMSQLQAEYEASLLTVHYRLTFAPFSAILTTVHNHSNMFFTVFRQSDAIDSMQVSPILGVVLVEYSNGLSYEYTNVSRRAILNLMCNPNMSLGFWVNDNCKEHKRVKYQALAV